MDRRCWVLGNIGPLASKPVMEGKAVLFKRFAGIDVFDIEVNETDPLKLVEVVAALEPTFGGINLEDIKAPDCFIIEGELIKRMRIPVFHDDQHGTAIITGAGLLNALEIAGKRIEDVRVVYNGAGASAIACADLHIALGVRLENIIMCDSVGVIHKGRTDDINPYKAAVCCRHTPPHPRRGPGGGRRVHRAFGRRSRQPGDGALDGAGPHRLRPGQPRPRDHLPGRAGRHGAT